LISSNPIVVGVLAGIASGLLLVASSSAGIFSALLALASPLPIYIAVLAWGTRGGVFASVSAIILVSVIASPQVAIMIAALMTLPALAIGHQANLAQSVSNDGKDLTWYPLDRLLFNLVNLIAIGFIVVGFMLGFSIEENVPDLVAQLKEFAKVNPAFKAPDDGDLAALARFYLGLLPFTFPAAWLVIHIVNMHLAVKIARSSGRMPRPQDDLPLDAGLPRMALIAFPTTLVLTIFSTGSFSNIFAVFAGAFFMAFSLVGLAALHLKARANPAARGLLVASYLLIIVFAVPLVVFTVAGVFRVASKAGLTAKNKPNE